MRDEIEIWGRIFNVSVDYDLYEGEEILDVQKNRLEKFLANNSLKKCPKLLFEFCLQQNGELIGDKIDNIFKYVIPRSVFIPRENEKIILLCDYKFDIEHGIAVVYKDNVIECVLPQDEVI